MRSGWWYQVLESKLNDQIILGYALFSQSLTGAGSLVAFSLGITDLDPLRYALLFERFLNPERVSMPDFDVDFCMDGRDRVIDYVAEKYGRNAVSQINKNRPLNTGGQPASGPFRHKASGRAGANAAGSPRATARRKRVR